LRNLVGGLGGDPAYLDQPERLPHAPHVVDVPAPRSGYVAGIDALACGLAAMRLGAGRATKTDTIDPAVGLVLRAKTGAYVEQGQPLATIHSRQPVPVDSLEDGGALDAGSNVGAGVVRQVLDAFRWSEAPVAVPPLILETIR
jgi:pyrimidine-nucleoside phosphorylase